MPEKPTPKGSPLSGRAVRHLRALGHALEPVIAIGKAGITDGLVDETKRALLQHELIKVKIMREAPVDRKEAGEALASATDATLAQVLGRTLLLYKRHPKKAKIVLPKDKPAAKAPVASEPASAPDDDGDFGDDDDLSDDGDVSDE